MTPMTPEQVASKLVEMGFAKSSSKLKEKRTCEARRKAENLKEDIELKKQFGI